MAVLYMVLKKPLTYVVTGAHIKFTMPNVCQFWSNTFCNNHFRDNKSYYRI